MLSGYSISYDSTTFIGTAIGYGEYFNGYIDRLRVTHGTALYTANFEPDPWSLDAYTGESTLIGNYDLALAGTDFSFFARYSSYSSSPRCVSLDSYQHPDAGVNAVLQLKTKLQSTTTLQFRRSRASQWYDDDQTDAQLHLWLCPNWTPGSVQYYPASGGWQYSMIQWYCMPQSLIFRLRYSLNGSIVVAWIKDGSTMLSINLSVITPWTLNEMNGTDLTKIVISTSGSGTQIDLYGGDGTLRQTGFDGTWTNIWNNARTLTTDLLAIHYHNYLVPSNLESFCDIQFGTEILTEGFVVTEYKNRQLLNTCLVSSPLSSTAMSYLLRSLPTLVLQTDSYRTEIYDPDTRYLDMLDGGTTTVSGTVTMTGSSNRVFLVSKGSSVVRETLSDPDTGYYEFTNMKDQPYSIYSDVFLLNTLPVLYTGTGRIFGEVTIPGSHRIILLEYLTYKPIAWTLSDSVTGAYEFNGLSTTILFTLIAEHDSKRYVIRAKMRAE